jgi:hypothetical protein
MRQISAPLSGLATILMLSTFCLHAQETRATLSGTVTDASGATVPAATVHLLTAETNEQLTATSNDQGQYRFLFVNPGTYRLTAEKTGFKLFQRDGIQLSVGEAATLDISMLLGSQSETVTVSASAPLLEAEKSDLGTVVDQNNLKQLPIIGRVPILMVTLSPGVISTQVSYNIAPFSNGGMTSWSINGSISPSAEFLLDGAPNDMIYQATYSVAYIPSVDAVEEMKVVTGAYDAQYGREGGAAISILTKNGTNIFHGSAYEYLQRPFLNANSFANNSTGLPVSYNNLNQYGLTVGGPVWIPKVYNGKNRTFFFFGYEEYLDQTVANSALSSVPTAAQRNGDFSQTFSSSGQLMPIYDPQSGQSVNGQWVRTTFPGNIIPSSRFDSTGANIVGLFPLPNFPTSGPVNWQNNYISPNDATKYYFDNFIGRIDQQISEKERIYGRYANNDQLLKQISNQLPGPGADYRWGDKVNNALVLDSLTILSPTTTFDLRLSMNRWLQNYRPPNWGSDNATAIGWSQSLVDQLPQPNRFPYLTFANYNYLGESGSNVIYAPSTTEAFAPVVVMTRGKHMLKTGIDLRIMHLSSYNSSYAGGTFAFDQGFTRANYSTADSVSGNAIASALLGVPSSGSVNYLADPYYRWAYYAPWVQDDIKVTRRLTLNLGVRWDVLSPITDSHNRLNFGFFGSQLNPISSQINQALFPGYQVYGGIGFAGVNGNPRSPFHTDWNNIQPRIGAAFRVTESTVIRGGFGSAYLPQISTGVSDGFSQTTPYVATTNAGESSAGIVSNPFPAGILAPPGSSLGLGTFLGQAPAYVDASGKIGYVYNFSFGVQQVLPGQVRLDASYVGSRTYDVGITNSIDALSLQNLALGDPSKGGSANYLNQAVANPFQGLLSGTSLNSATIPLQQKLLPYPEFTGVSQQNIPVGRVWYNSLQIGVQRRYAKGFAMTGSYTLSKNLQALNYLNAQDAATARSLTQYDRTQVLVLAPIYELPFGPGRPFVNSTNGLLSRLVGGWQLIANFSWMSGLPMAMPAGVNVIGNPVLPNPTWNKMFNTGLINANGQVTDVVGGLPPAFEIRGPFQLNNASLYVGNLRDRWGPECNISFVKSTAIRERLRLEIRAEMLDAFNHPIFGGNPNITATSPLFGTLVRNSGQTNEPRTIQLSGKLVF